MYDMTQEELLDAVEMEDREWLGTDDIHPYKSCVPKSKSNTVSFPNITKFNTYLLRHYGAAIVEELSEMMYDGQLAGVCGVDGFHSQRLTRDKCRIDPRMSFWRRNKIEFIADIVVYLNVSCYCSARLSQNSFVSLSKRRVLNTDLTVDRPNSTNYDKLMAFNFAHLDVNCIDSCKWHRDRLTAC